jgi:hypothetical protein
MLQVTAAVGLSAGIRSEPLMTVVNGTRVARPARAMVVGPPQRAALEANFVTFARRSSVMLCGRKPANAQ